MTNIVCAFPGLGKTWCPDGIDLDYGKVRSFFKLDFSNENVKQRGRGFVGECYVHLINYFAKTEDLIFINEPHVDFSLIEGNVIFMVPDFGVSEWLDRIARRGDDLKADWVRYIRSHYQKCINDWITIAETNGFEIRRIQTYITDDCNGEYGIDEYVTGTSGRDGHEFFCLACNCPCGNEDCDQDPNYDW